MSLSEETKTIQTFIKAHPQISKIDKKELSDFYIQLIDCLVDHNHAYYIDTKPLISDKEYDDLFAYLKKIEEAHPELISSSSPTQGLIGQVSEGFSKKEHERPLLSLENTYDAEDLKDWDTRIYRILEKKWEENTLPNTITYKVEPKFDGLSVELIYVNGELTSAITRGDGKVGEEIIANAKTIEGLKTLKIKDESILHVRGEIVMPKSVWKELNKERIEDGETPFANTRNAAAGSIKLLDPNEVRRRRLDCYVYDILLYETKERNKKNITNIESKRYFGQEETDKLLEQYGLPVFPRGKTCDWISEIIDICNNPSTKKDLDTQDIEFDGLVIKVQDQQQREIIGSTEHHPRRAVAYKFPAQLAATQITSVDFQVGRTGIITPVANFNPVQLSGAKLQRVSLHNFDFITDKDIHLHDWIRLQRSGEVIPYIVSVITDRRTGEEETIHPPKVCPSCKEAVTQKDMHYYCMNEHCPEKTKQQIQHFVSKNCMDIMGIGETIVDILVDNNIIENIADIYKLTDPMLQMTLRRFPGFGDKKVAEISKGVEESKHKALRRLLNGLGIPHVGKKMAQDIAEQLKSNDFINEITQAEFLSSIYGIGEKTEESIGIFFHNKHNLKLLEQLQQAGVNFNPSEYNDLIKTDAAKGTFSITGTFDLPREKIAELFQQQGYLFHESPIKTTDFILIGDKAGSKKTKAQELGIKIYEGRETMIKEFPFLKTISNDTNKPKIQSLF